MSIVILSRPIRTGKTTELLQWSERHENIEGILMPDIDGVRKMLDIKTKEIFDAECTDSENTKEALTSVGRFHFYTFAFNKANEILMSAVDTEPDWLVIDEIGKLELAGKGFYDAFLPVAQYYSQTQACGNLLISVRENLCEDVIEFFGLKNYSIVSSIIELG